MCARRSRTSSTSASRWTSRLLSAPGGRRPKADLGARRAAAGHALGRVGRAARFGPGEGRARGDPRGQSGARGHVAQRGLVGPYRFSKGCPGRGPAWNGCCGAFGGPHGGGPDPIAFPRSRTVAWPIASRLVHALGYPCAEVHVTRAPSGRRAVAVRRRDVRDLGPTPMLWTRSDDANDTIEREDRRSLRASLLWMKWLDVTRVGPATMRDFFVGAPTAGYVEHRIVDLSAAFGVGRLDESIDRATDPLRDNPGAGWMLLSLGFAPDDGPSDIPSSGTGLVAYRAGFRGLDREVSPPFAPHDHARADDLYWMARRMAAVSWPVIDRALEAGQIGDVDERNRIWRLLGRRRAALQLVAYSLVTPVRPRHIRMWRSAGSWNVELALVDDEALLRGPFERSYDATLFSRDGERLAQSVVTASTKRFGVAMRIVGEPSPVVVLRVTRLRREGDGRPMEIHIDTATGGVVGIVH